MSDTPHAIAIRYNVQGKWPELQTDIEIALAAVRRETAQRCAEIARKGPVGGTTIAAAITKEFGPWE